MVMLSYVNIFARDIEALSAFYADVFGFEEILPSRSPIFRGLKSGECCLGFSAAGAYELLGLEDYSESEGVVVMTTFDADSVEEVDRLVEAAVAKGATLIKLPFETYYHWYQAVLFDPEGNAFRINKILA